MASLLESRTPPLRRQDDSRTGTPPVGSHQAAESAQAQDHPIFLRACHSPWDSISQRTLVYIRAFIVLYLTAVGGMLIEYNLERDDKHNGWFIIFQFSTVTFLSLWLYHLLVFGWTYTRLYYPDIDEEDHRWEYRILRLMSPPIQTAYSSNHFYFSMFYTAVHVGVFMDAFIFWALLVPLGQTRLPGDNGSTGRPVDDLFSNGWFASFCVIQQWGCTVLIALIEIMALNSIKRPVPVDSHLVGTMFLCCCYLTYATVGWMLTGHSAFFWMDPSEAGMRYFTTGFCVIFVYSSVGMFPFMYGLIRMREYLTSRKGDDEAQFNPDAPDSPEEYQRHI